MPRWLKILVAVTLLSVLAAAVDWHALPAQLARLRAWPLLLAMLVTALQMPANAWKWWWALRLHDVHLGWPFLMRASCAAYFLNNFLPSGIGGDVYRIYRTVPAGGEKTPAISAVLVERLVGLKVMLVNGSIGALVLADSSGFARSYLTIAVSALVLGVCAAGVLYAGGMGVMTRRLASVAMLAPFGANLQRVARLRVDWWWLLVSSFTFQLLAAAVMYLAFLAVGAPVSPAGALLITAAAGIASVLPISISGIGVVEGAIAGSAVALGVPYEAAVLAAIAVRLVVLPVSAGCGLVYLCDDGARARTA
jgi:glycosyltransferase 2 family protein